MGARLDESMARQIRRIRPIPRAELDSRSQAIAAQIERDFGAFVPPFALHAAAPDLLAACWMMVREALVVRHVDRLRKEVVATAVSRANACTYCVDAHSTAVHALGDAATADALTDAGLAEHAHGPLAPLIAWASATRSPDDPRLRDLPFSATEAPELLGIALAFHYINRMVAVFLVPSPMPFESGRMKGWTRRLVSPLVRRPLQRVLTPGDSLQFLSDAALPRDLVWAASHPTLGSALARASAAFEAAGAAAVPAPVRALVQTRLHAWRGEAMGLDRRWLDDAVAPLEEPLRIAARLCLMTAFAPYQLDDAIIAHCRSLLQNDADLVGATAWVSFDIARRITAWVAA